MKNIKLILTTLSLAVLFLTAGCGNDDDGDGPMTPPVVAPTADAGADQTVEIDANVMLDASTTGGDQPITYAWTVSGPSNTTAELQGANTATPNFVADVPGEYTATVTATNDAGETSDMVTITVTNNATFSRADHMGRPAINTVFNYFGTSGGKDAYNQMTLPSAPVAASADFEFIFDNLQEYAGLDSDTYTNALGLNNTQTSGVLIVDALNSNKNFPSTYGPSDLGNISLFENVLNGRKLSDDVVDVTLILTFGGDLSDPPTGLIGDNVSYESASTDAFPYLASPN